RGELGRAVGSSGGSRKSGTREAPGAPQRISGRRARVSWGLSLMRSVLRRSTREYADRLRWGAPLLPWGKDRHARQRNPPPRRRGRLGRRRGLVGAAATTTTGTGTTTTTTGAATTASRAGGRSRSAF